MEDGKNLICLVSLSKVIRGRFVLGVDLRKKAIAGG
jgi:hypothetical protein